MVETTAAPPAPSSNAASLSSNTGSADAGTGSTQASSGPPSSNLTLSQQNAVDSAQSYLQISGFSKQGLIDQLSSSAGSGYPVHDATVAVDSLAVNWDAEAVRSAKSYLQASSFSCQGLVQQLSSSAGSQYTAAQAQYAATKVGLCVGDTGNSSGVDTGGTPAGSTSSRSGYTYTATVPATSGTPSKADSWPNCFGGGISASTGISCSLANNAFYEYWNAANANGADPSFQITVEAWADATQQYYATSCKTASDGTTIECAVHGTTEGNSTVSFPLSAVNAYSATQSSAYANAHYVGPNG